MISVKLAKVPYRANAKTFSLDTAKFSSCYGNGIGSVGVRFNPDPDQPGQESLQIDMNSKDARLLAYRLEETADAADARTPFLRKLQDDLDEIVVGLKELLITREQAQKAAQRALDLLSTYIETKGRES